LNLNNIGLQPVSIIGGGLAGLICAIDLNKKSIPNIVIEKKEYPFHRVCGEYVSQEATNYLKSLGVYPEKFSPPQINRLQLSSVNGSTVILPLQQGGFGISRYNFDNFLYQTAKDTGTKFYLNTTVTQIQNHNDHFEISCNNELNLKSQLVIGAFGKRSTLDRTLDRSSFAQKSPYVGVKYHIRYDIPIDLIAIHNFTGGYCGISRVEGDTVNLCYLSTRENLKKYGSIKKLETERLYKNPFLKAIFTEAEFLFSEPKVINEISFESKIPVENHVLMAGDSAGMITPLCGNGMAMAINAGKILSGLIFRFYNESNYSMEDLEKEYAEMWRTQFGVRMKFGRRFQKLFGGYNQSNLAVGIAKYFRPLALWMIRQTHGTPF